MVLITVWCECLSAHPFSVVPFGFSAVTAMLARAVPSMSC